MITIDLITGFLGAGKTTFIEKYARFLLAQGERICILENDYGAINIDRVLLKDLLGPNCELEMVVGGDGAEAHQRRFRTKLISMAMLGYTRVLVEPSGIYDVDEFFDTLYENPLDRWYTVGSVLAIVDAQLDPSMSAASRYLLAAEAACAGKIILSKLSSDSQVEKTLSLLNQAMAEIQCTRRFHFPEDVLAKPWDQLKEGDFRMLQMTGYKHTSFTKQVFAEKNVYQSLFYMHYETTQEDLKARVLRLMQDPAAGHILRIKGFSSGLEVNVTKEEQRFTPQTTKTEDVLIVIGEDLQKDIVASYFPEAVTV